MLHSFFFVLLQDLSIFLTCSLIFILWFAGTAKSIILLLLFSFFKLSLGLVVWPGLGDLFISQNSREFYASHSLGWILGYAYIPVVRMVKFKFLAQFFVDHFPYLFISSFILFFALVYCIRLLCD